MCRPLGKIAVHAPIVGVVADLKYSKIDADPGPEVFAHYFPHANVRHHHHRPDDR